MKIPTARIKELRDQTGAGIMDCRNALLEAEGDTRKALQILEQQNLAQAQKKARRPTTQGIIEAYIHTGGRVGAMVEVNCETDFVARTDEFKELAHHLAMQIAAQDPQFVSREEVPEGADMQPEAACLLLQPYIKNPDKTVQDIIAETIAKVGENIKVSRFARFELGAFGDWLERLLSELDKPIDARRRLSPEMLPPDARKRIVEGIKRVFEEGK